MFHHVCALTQKWLTNQGKKMKKLSNVETTKLTQILVSKTEQEMFEETKSFVEKPWSKPLRLEVDKTAKSMWEAVCREGKIKAACKGLFCSLLVLFRKEKGSDHLPKLLNKWVILLGDIIYNHDHNLTRSITELCLNICSSDNATAFSAKLTSCIVMAVKDVFWGFVYGEKLDQEKKEQDQSTGAEDRG